MEFVVHSQDKDVDSLLRWKSLYANTLLETNPIKMRLCLEETKTAILDRMEDVVWGHPRTVVKPEELAALREALQMLKRLERLFCPEPEERKWVA